MSLMSLFFSEWLTNSNCSGSKSSSERLGERALDPVVEDDPPDRGQEVLVPGPPVLGVVVQLAAAVLVGQLGLLGGAERPSARSRCRCVPLPAFSSSSSFASSSPSGP